MIRCVDMSAGVCGGLGHVDRNDGAVLPETLETVVDALLLVEDVHDQVAEIEQHPPGFCTSLTSYPLVARLDQSVLDLIGDRGDVALAVFR